MSGDTAESPRASLPGREERSAVSVAPDVDDILSVAFDLSTHDLRVYHALIDRPSATTQELAEVIGINQSNVNRSLGRLRDCDLVHRRRRLLQKDGHYYLYTATDIDEARELLRKGLGAWTERARDELQSVLVPEP